MLKKPEDAAREVPRGLIRSAVLAGPCAAYAFRHGDLPNTLSDCGLSARIIEEQEAVLDTDQYLEVMARIGHSGGDMFLFQAGLNTSLDEFGLTGQAVQSASTLGEAIELTGQILGYLQSNSSIEIDYRRGRCQLRYNADFGQSGEIAPDLQYSIGVFSNLISLAQHKYDMELKISCPGAKNVSVEALQSSARFQDSQTAVVEFDQRLLQSPMPKSNGDRSEVLRRFLGTHSISKASTMSLTDTVRELVEHSMGIAKPAQRLVSSMLGMGPRALQRALKQEGTSFRQIIEASRKSIALRELRNGKSVTETAFLLGYDHPQNLTSACYRWYGRSASSL
ncbi:helix-turn-helix domain-containing protein [Marimonas sp. MJW-29]|uniref:Helix-turn-helix domain-containing protein n=1 Tax=Sulfitobacter sediminis TaxID=3234186 RepID=A0ABV3RHN1_9RHOB